MSTLKNNDSCQHDEYCGLSKTVCVETDFKEKCLMKESSVEEMPLLKKVKECVKNIQARSCT
ncbi:hypothetical protein [Sulfurimonas sp.]|uniref:hypothetical protein n=1 Tax=Sulfurimonas sp. TaxID=2022749 RepID=UPI00356A4D5A